MFDRIAICEAYYMYASLHHSGQSSKEYAYFGRLDRIGYKPGLAAQSQDPDRLSDDSRIIYDSLVNRNSGQVLVNKQTDRVITRANRILEAAKRSVGDQRTRIIIECIQLHYNGYAEPGYADPEHGLIATGNWNDTVNWVGQTRFIVSDIPSRIAKLFTKLGIPTEWEDEWIECSHCGKLVRSQPDSMSWKPSYTMGDGELWCHECDS